PRNRCTLGNQCVDLLESFAGNWRFLFEIRGFLELLLRVGDLRLQRVDFRFSCGLCRAQRAEQKSEVTVNHTCKQHQAEDDFLDFFFFYFHWAATFLRAGTGVGSGALLWS